MAMSTFIVLGLVVLIDVLVSYKLYQLLMTNKEKMKNYVRDFRQEIAIKDMATNDKIEKSIARALERNKNYKKKYKDTEKTDKKDQLR